MGANVLDFEQMKLEMEADKIVSELIHMGGVKWAACTVSQIPRFADCNQELLRIKLKERLSRISRHLL